MIDEEREWKKEWKLDIYSTMIANIIGALFIFAVLIFIVLTIAFITNIDNENTKIIALIVYMFSVIQLLKLVRHPTLEYKRREEAGK